MYPIQFMAVIRDVCFFLLAIGPEKPGIMKQIADLRHNLLQASTLFRNIHTRQNNMFKRLPLPSPIPQNRQHKLPHSLCDLQGKFNILIPLFFACSV